MKKGKWLLGFLACLLFVSFAHAQINTGEIIGTVLLADGTALPGVNVTLTGDVTGKMAVVTSDRGPLSFSETGAGLLQPGL